MKIREFLPLLLWGILFLSGKVKALDTFLLTQCECPNLSFSSLENTGEVSTFTATPGDGFICPGDDRGITRDFEADAFATASLTGTIEPTLFNENGERSMWFGVVEVDYQSQLVSPEEIEIELLQIDFGSGRVFTLTLEFAFGSGVGSRYTFGGENAVVAASGLDTVVFGEFQENNYGINSGFFVCFGPANSGMVACASSTDSTPVIGDITETVDVRILGLDITGDITLRAFAFEEENTVLADIASVETGDADALLTAAGIDLNQPALPIFNDVVLDAVEDEVLLDVTLTDFLGATDLDLQFTVDDPLLISDLGTLATFDENTATFATFTPVANAFGNASFSFSYTSTDIVYDCTLTVDDAVIEIAAVEDVPVLVAVDDIQTVAFVKDAFSAVVANSIDFPDGEGSAGPLETGFVRVAALPTSGTLFTFDGSVCTDTELEADTPVELVNGEFQFCYEGNQGNTAGESDSFTYTVRPESDLSANEAIGTGTITLLGSNPVNPNPDVQTRFLRVQESSVDNDFVLDVDVEGAVDSTDSLFALLDSSLAVGDFTFQIEITALPDPSVGTLTTSNGAAIAQNDRFNDRDTIRFTPAAGFFNANEEGTEENDANVNLFGIDCEEAEKITGVCPDTSFRYRLVFGTGDGVETEEVTFNLVVTAIDDAGADFSVGQEEAIIANSNDATNGFINVDGSTIQVTSDLGGNVFNIGVRYVGVGGTLIKLPVRAGTEPQGFRLDGDVLSNDDCITAGCEIMHLIGTPAQLNSFLDDVEFEVPVEEDGAPPRVDVFLASGVEFNVLQSNVNEYNADPSVSIEFDVQALEEGFFDDPQNVAIVAGAGGGFLLIVLVAGIVKATSVKSVNGNKVGRLSETGPKEFKQRGGVAASKQPKRKRSFEEDDEDEENPPPKATKGDPLLDWEKHIDPDTKQPFYHNTRTKETVWELPEGL